MSIKSKKCESFIRKASLLVTVSLFSGTLFAAADAETSVTNEEMRHSESIHFSTGGRENNRDPAKGEVSVDEYPAIVKGKERDNSVSKQAGNVAAQSGSYDFWFYDTDVVLFNDDDNDGFFYGIDLWFDADTIYNAADVYVVVYLSYEGGPWNEYAVSEDFTLNGASPSDDYVMVTELMSGYPTGEYDLLIEMFDAWNGDFLASFGPSDTSELAYLPLEDFNRDAPVVETRVVVVTEQGGGGALGIWMLLLGALAARRLSVHRSR